MNKIILIAVLFVFDLFAKEILVLNSNAQVEKYDLLQKEFEKDFKGSHKVLDIGNMNVKEVKEYLYDEYPDIVFAIGAKAYKVANKFIPEKEIFFSGIINYKRLGISKKRYGVANEVYPGMKLTLASSFFGNMKKIAIVYSSYTQELFKEYKAIGSKMGLEIIGQKIDKDTKIDKKKLLQSDGFILTSDPILLKDKEILLGLLKTLQENKKVIIAYHELFLQYGASFIVKVDDPTIARQISSMIRQNLAKNGFEHIQNPMGTEVIFNKKLADSLGIEYNGFALSIVNKVIE